MRPTFELSKEQKTKMIGLIQEYFERELNEQIGNLQAMLLIDFICEKFGPEFYNLGVEDSHRYMIDKIDGIFEIQK